MKDVMGIDPGADGAIVVLNKHGEVYASHLKEIEFAQMKEIIKEHNPEHVYMEKAQVMSKQGVQGVRSMFTYGTGYGRLIGWLEALEVPYTLIPPATWSKKVHVGCTGRPKEKSQQAITRLCPSQDFYRTPRNRFHLGIVDAYLIAYYGQSI